MLIPTASVVPVQGAEEHPCPPLLPIPVLILRLSNKSPLPQQVQLYLKLCSHDMDTGIEEKFRRGINDQGWAIPMAIKVRSQWGDIALLAS